MPSLTFEPLETTSSPYINHFLQPDTIIPDLSNPQTWNRYSYVNNNPLRYSDPTGHMKTEGCGDDGKDKCHASDLEIAINTQKEKKLQYDVDKRMCKAGDLDRCDGFTRDAKQFVADFKNGFSSFIADAYDTCIASPLGGCPPVTNFFPLLSDGAKWKIEHGKDIGLGVSDLVSNKIQVATPQFSPTPYMLSPTVSPTATITLYYTPTVTMTSTSSPTISPTWTSTVGVSPSATSTPTPAYRLQ